MIIFRCVNVRYAIQIDFLLLSTALNNHVLERKKYCRVVSEGEVLEEFNKNDAGGWRLDAGCEILDAGCYLAAGVVPAD